MRPGQPKDELTRPDGVILAAAPQIVIETRESSHGDYSKQAACARAIKDIIDHDAEGLTPAQRESLDMIAVKISRILNGNPNEPDHWLDISGYATLVHNLLTKGTHL